MNKNAPIKPIDTSKSAVENVDDSEGLINNEISLNTTKILDTIWTIIGTIRLFVFIYNTHILIPKIVAPNMFCKCKIPNTIELMIIAFLIPNLKLNLLNKYPRNIISSAIGAIRGHYIISGKLYV